MDDEMDDETVTTAGKKTVEVWAEAKGMLPEYLKVKTRVGGREAFARKQNPKFVDFAMAKAHARWPEGKEVTEKEFDEAVQGAAQVGAR
jgi:hypothetical protein